MALQKFTPALTKKLLAALTEGMPMRAACGEVGLHKSTYYDWIAKAKAASAAADTGEKLTAEQQRLIVFMHDCDLANAAAEARWFRKFVAEAEKDRGKGNWLPFLKILAVRWPDHWAERRIEAALTDAEPDAYDLELSKLSREEILELRKLVQKAKREEPSDEERKLRAV